MRVVLFCGGYGLRLRDHEPRVPKPAVPLGGEPLVLHVMRYYAHHGHDDFVLCLGYQGDVVRRAVESAMAAAAARGDLGPRQDPSRWTVRFVDTGTEATVADRLVAVRELLAPGETFLANYSDALTDAPLAEMVTAHRRAGAAGSFMVVKPHLSLHHVTVDAATGAVASISGIRDSVRINGGYFVLEPEVFDHIEPGDELVERPFARLIARGRLYGHVYDGYWSTVDTFKDHMRLTAELERGVGPWQVWRAPMALAG